MLIRLHKKAATTPAIREYIRDCGKPVKALARELNLNVGTVRKWRGREDAQDASHRPHTMRTTLSPAQEALVVELRRTVLLSLDDLVAVTRAHIHPGASRAAVGRLLKREGVSRLADLLPAEEGEAAPKKTFKDYAPGYLHIDLKELPRMPETRPTNPVSASPSHRASRWAYFESARQDRRWQPASWGASPKPARSRSRRSSPTTARSSPTASPPRASASRPAAPL